MKRYVPFALIFLALLASSIWFYLHQTKGSVDKREGNFAVKDAKDIFRIVLTDTENKTIELTNPAGVWMVNGKYPAREDLVNQLMDALTRVSSFCPVPSAAHDNVLKEMMAHHVRAAIYDKEGTLLKSYLVGGPSVDGQTTYMLLDIDGQPAVRPHMTYIPGFKGYLTLRYSTDAENWRSRALYNYKPGEIKELVVAYSGNIKNSFSISAITKDSFELKPLDNTFKITETYRQKYILQYLSFFSSIFIEAYENDNPVKDSVLTTSPFCTITITENDNSKNEVKLYYMLVNKRTKALVDASGEVATHDMEHYYASIHQGKDFALVQYYVFGKLLRHYSDFFFKPAAESK